MATTTKNANPIPLALSTRLAALGVTPPPPVASAGSAVVVDIPGKVKPSDVVVASAAVGWGSGVAFAGVGKEVDSVTEESHSEAAAALAVEMDNTVVLYTVEESTSLTSSVKS